MSIGRYTKSITALVGAILTWAGVAFIPDGHVDRPEWYALAIALATAAGVFTVTNTAPPYVPPLEEPAEAPALGYRVPQAL